MEKNSASLALGHEHIIFIKTVFILRRVVSRQISRYPLPDYTEKYFLMQLQLFLKSNLPDSFCGHKANHSAFTPQEQISCDRAVEGRTGCVIGANSVSDKNTMVWEPLHKGFISS